MAKYLDQNGLAYFWSKIKAAIQAAPDTKNTAGATDTSSKIYIVGATSQGDNPQTYTQDTAYVGTDGHVYSDSKQVVNLSGSQSITNKTYNGLTLTAATTGFTIAGGTTSKTLTVGNTYTLGAACEKSVDTSISASSTSTNLPTSAAVASLISSSALITSVDTTGSNGLRLTLTSGELDLEVNTGTITEDTTNPSRNYFVTGVTIASAFSGMGQTIQGWLADKADIASPAFTGTPTAPTASIGTNTTQIATTAFVTSAVEAAQIGVASFRGTTSCQDNEMPGDHQWSFPRLTNYKRGWYWVVASDGTYAGQLCEAGDMIYCISDYVSAYSASDFDVVQNNVVAITNAEIDTIVAS